MDGKDRSSLNITADTNVLIRAVVRDDEAQASIAAKALMEADKIAVTLPCLCEFVWVLLRLYDFKTQDIANAIRALTSAANVQVNRPATEAGLAMLEAGGDFADGVIAFEGRWLGGDTFVSFDKKAVALLKAQGLQTELLTTV
jgi:predicted nucleic-acid-binding protein